MSQAPKIQIIESEAILKHSILLKTFSLKVVPIGKHGGLHNTELLRKTSAVANSEYQFYVHHETYIFSGNNTPYSQKLCTCIISVAKCSQV